MADDKVTVSHAAFVHVELGCQHDEKTRGNESFTYPADMVTGAEVQVIVKVCCKCYPLPDKRPRDVTKYLQSRHEQIHKAAVRAGAPPRARRT